MQRVSLAVASNNHRAIAVYRAKFGFDEVALLESEFNNGQQYRLMRLDLATFTPRAAG